MEIFIEHVFAGHDDITVSLKTNASSSILIINDICRESGYNIGSSKQVPFITSANSQIPLSINGNLTGQVFSPSGSFSTLLGINPDLIWNLCFEIPPGYPGQMNL